MPKFLTRRIPIRRKAVSPRLKLNRNHPLGRHIDFCFAPQGSILEYGPSAEKYPAATHTGGVGVFTLVDTPYGRGVSKPSGSGADVIYFGQTTDFQIGTDDFTIYVRAAMLGAGGTADSLIGKGDTGAGEWMVDTFNNSPANARMYGDAPGTLIFPNLTLSPATSLGVFYDVCACRIGTTAKIYFREVEAGALQQATDNTGGGTISETNHYLSLFGSDYNGVAVDSVREFEGTITHAYVIPGYGATEPEVVALFNNPNQVFEGRRIWVPVPAAVGAYTLTADSGSFAITGTAATLQHDKTLAAASDSYAITGTAADLEYGRNLVAESGSYTWTGTAATLTYTPTGNVLTAEGGSYAWIGTAATLQHDKVIAAATTSYSWTGTAASLLKGRTLTADGGSYTWTGTAATPQHDKVLLAETTSYAWAGTAATLTYSGAPAPAAAREGAGRPSKKKKRKITVDGRTYTVSSVEEERQIVEAFVAKLEAQRAAQEKPTPQLKRKITIQKRRLQSLQQTEEIGQLMHRQLLLQEDEEILMLLAAEAA